jgi:hypothetical protein
MSGHVAHGLLPMHGEHDVATQAGTPADPATVGKGQFEINSYAKVKLPFTYAGTKADDQEKEPAAVQVITPRLVKKETALRTVR